MSAFSSWFSANQNSVYSLGLTAVEGVLGAVFPTNNNYAAQQQANAAAAELAKQQASLALAEKSKIEAQSKSVSFVGQYWYFMVGGFAVVGYVVYRLLKKGGSGKKRYRR